MISSTTVFVLCTSFLCLCCRPCLAKSNITTGESIIDGVDDYLESPGNKFRMGFFPHNRTLNQKRYVGIWYTMDPDTIVWVANRDKPVPHSTGVLKVEEDGNVKLLDKEQIAYFSTGIGGASSRTMKLLNNGNAVLMDTTGTVVWESFNNPTDTFLPGMKMVAGLKLTSWTSPDNPKTGTFTFQQDSETNQYVILNGSTMQYWKSRSGSKKSFDQNQRFSEAYFLLTNSTERAQMSNYQQHFNNTYSYQNFTATGNYLRLLMSYTGKIQYFRWADGENQWVMDWQEPKDSCSVYRACGPFEVCSLNLNGDPMCSCLFGFEPTSSGCTRTSEICRNDSFLNKTGIQVENPALPSFPSNNESDCIKKCLEDCQCQAYSYVPQNNETLRSRGPSQASCWIWDSDLNNLQENGKHNISIRISRSTKGLGSSNSGDGSTRHKGSSSFLTVKHVMILALTTLVILLICSLSYIFYKKIVTRKQERNSVLQLKESERQIKDFLELNQSREEDTEGIGVPFFEFESILIATDNFSDSNKLGQGGFGPVYKGKLPGGLEIAVKRLSSLSGQGIEEFKNEVVLIAKLQHRNLVRLLGYCMKGSEKILIYEYMPNKSLDAFIFDRELHTSLDWPKRLEIILGIARGLLYLHQDSRLRIIHRDLKTSNILLDEEMNPKISDFGLAKIVKGKQMEDSTNRVIGTYGYMAPEYALDGLFSVKSDVFSFGVVMLEIISGRRNTGFYQPQQAPSLLGHAWSLWKEDKPFEFMDQALLKSSNSREVLKCIIVGLLCVQEDPSDRPTMTNVILMLGGDIASLPTPRQPAFVARKAMSSSSSSSYRPDNTNNTLTITMEEGR